MSTPGCPCGATGAPCSSVCHQSPGVTASITFTPGFAGPQHSHALRMAPGIWAAPQIKTSVKSPKPECRDQQGVVILCLLSDEVWGHQVKLAQVCSPQQMRKNWFTKFVFKFLSAAWQRGYKKFTRIQKDSSIRNSLNQVSVGVGRRCRSHVCSLPWTLTLPLAHTGERFCQSNSLFPHPFLNICVKFIGSCITNMWTLNAPKSSMVKLI